MQMQWIVEILDFVHWGLAQLHLLESGRFQIFLITTFYLDLLFLFRCQHSIAYIQVKSFMMNGWMNGCIYRFVDSAYTLITCSHFWIVFRFDDPHSYKIVINLVRIAHNDDTENQNQYRQLINTWDLRLIGPFRLRITFLSTSSSNLFDLE